MDEQEAHHLDQDAQRMLAKGIFGRCGRCGAPAPPEALAPEDGWALVLGDGGWTPPDDDLIFACPGCVTQQEWADLALVEAQHAVEDST